MFLEAVIVSAAVVLLAMKQKQLAGIDLTTTNGKRTIKEYIEDGFYDKYMINQIQKYTNSIQLPNIQWTGKDTNYLRNIYYNPEIKKSFNNAIKLLLIIHTNYYDSGFECIRLYDDKEIEKSISWIKAIKAKDTSSKHKLSEAMRCSVRYQIYNHKLNKF